MSLAKFCDLNYCADWGERLACVRANLLHLPCAVPPLARITSFYRLQFHPKPRQARHLGRAGKQESKVNNSLIWISFPCHPNVLEAELGEGMKEQQSRGACQFPHLFLDILTLSPLIVSTRPLTVSRRPPSPPPPPPPHLQPLPAHLHMIQASGKHRRRASPLPVSV